MGESEDKHSFKIIVWALILCIFVAVPNYFRRGRTQLVYLNEKGERISTPIVVYIVNALLPEEELMNVGMKATALLPSETLSPVFKNLGAGLSGMLSMISGMDMP